MMKFAMFLLFSTVSLAEQHVQQQSVGVRAPAVVRIENEGNRTFRVLADGTRLEVKGVIQSGPGAGGRLSVQASPEQCEVRVEGAQSNIAVMGRAVLQSRSIPIQFQARGLNGKTDTVSKTILGGERGGIWTSAGD